MFGRKRLPFICVFFILFLGCASGTVKDTGGPSVSVAQAVSAVGPKARIAVALKNISGGFEERQKRKRYIRSKDINLDPESMIKKQAEVMREADRVGKAVDEYQRKLFIYHEELRQYQARLNKVGSEKAGLPPKAPKFPKMNSSPSMNLRSDPVAGGIRNMMINALFNSKRFIILERENIEKLNLEQEINHSATSGNKTGLPTAQIQGAELLLNGSINNIKLNPKPSDKHYNEGLLLSVYDAMSLKESMDMELKMLNQKSKEFKNVNPFTWEDLDYSWNSAKVSMHLRLVDTRTSRVVAATTVEGKATDKFFGISKTKYKYNAGDLPSSFSVFQNTPVEDAFRKMIDAAVEFLLTKTPENYYHHQE